MLWGLILGIYLFGMGHYWFKWLRAHAQSIAGEHSRIDNEAWVIGTIVCVGASFIWPIILMVVGIRKLVRYINRNKDKAEELQKELDRITSDHKWELMSKDNKIEQLKAQITKMAEAQNRGAQANVGEQLITVETRIANAINFIETQVDQSVFPDPDHITHILEGRYDA
jgi:hypothetical protein